ncbi:GSU2403 family nucleotidyltransferase fold protein [Variovorax sp. NFACC27]|uniref:GSU2403 family nucleotidyltransferase fold protein n=1 Tax=unclassified Variovorax TaxID=663243 RepID=UPI000896AEEB|nr:GSU2403 family nucleotidyltransferase fold protein [Variovorax sp. YR750]MDP9606203.1 hypothetical protein [Variovorax paradoxus]SEF35336.1 Nucleotidyltransferase [Variovorax sp. NFACC28]SEG99323.1 Nucleotidyltransferase [Variovorax sp. NFACC29]SFE21795.1 Nucleotidyltransferase [Variovorax sp. NFACC26]SFH26821.1 Nucleotidyltransferase [Variovorax sp. NFACC27]
MKLPRTSDTAAKQILDATRVYREYARVRKESQRLKGSLFWKKVGSYEYLAHKVHGKVTYVGPRGAETEREFEEFKQKKAQLQQRARTLKESVETCERMNKAVRAGAVPTPVVEVLRQLEDAGLSEGSVVLGTSALFAYGQPSGVRVEEVASPVHGSVVEDAKQHLQVLLEAPESAIKAALLKLRQAADAIVEVAPAGASGERTYFLVEFKFGRQRELSKCWAENAYWRTLATEMATEIRHAGKFEQVVIGKTGTMATMRTLDPQFFAMINHALAEARPATMQEPHVAQCQAVLVDSLIADHRVVSKPPAVECRRAVEGIAQRVFAHG